MKQRKPPIPKAKHHANASAARQTADRLRAAYAMHQQGDLDQAAEIYGEILQTEPDNFNAMQLLATVSVQKGNFAGAVDLFDRALKISPNYAEAHNNRGNALFALGRTQEALLSYSNALKYRPDYAEAHNNCGNALLELKRPEEATRSYGRALRINLNYPEAHNNLGNALRELKRPEDALASYHTALRLKPDYAEAWNNRGNTLFDLSRSEEALESYGHALRINPGHAEALSNRGNVLFGLRRLDEALESYTSALAIRPKFAQALCNRGIVLRELKRLDEALEDFAQALRISPEQDFLWGDWLHTKMKLCNWDGADTLSAQLAEKLWNSEAAAPPFAVLSLADSLPLQRKSAEIWNRDKHPASSALAAIPRYPEHSRIRLGYFSADFHNHATAYLMAELFERHDTSRFEMTAFSFGPDIRDEMRERISAAFDSFIDVRNHSDRDVALLARRFEIDIAIDLKGFTQDSRSGIFAHRAAPLQVSYLGYPGTMSAEYIDYLIADPTLIPEAHRQDYAEKIAYLPNSYQVNDNRRRISEKEFTREALDLPRDGFVFCCFNNSYKITPRTFAGWVRILKQVEGSVLWLLEDNATASRNLRKEAALMGIAPERLVFASRVPLADHLARHRQADLFLDTLPYNAHTTASDALWAGLPVLTCLGNAFAGRVAASLLNAIHMPELVTTSPEAYEALAIELASNPGTLAEIRRKLARNRLTTPLFDTPLFARHIDTAYRTMYERHQAGLPAEHIHVPP